MNRYLLFLAILGCTGREPASATPATSTAAARGPKGLPGMRGLPGPPGPAWRMSEHVYMKTSLPHPVPRDASIELASYCDSTDDLVISGGCAFDFGGTLRTSAPCGNGWCCHGRTPEDVLLYEAPSLTATVICLRAGE